MCFMASRRWNLAMCLSRSFPWTDPPLTRIWFTLVTRLAKIFPLPSRHTPFIYLKMWARGGWIKHQKAFATIANVSPCLWVCVCVSDLIITACFCPVEIGICSFCTSCRQGTGPQVVGFSSRDANGRGDPVTSPTLHDFQALLEIGLKRKCYLYSRGEMVCLFNRVIIETRCIVQNIEEQEPSYKDKLDWNCV